MWERGVKRMTSYTASGEHEHGMQIFLSVTVEPCYNEAALRAKIALSHSIFVIKVTTEK